MQYNTETRVTIVTVGDSVKAIMQCRQVSERFWFLISPMEKKARGCFLHWLLTSVIAMKKQESKSTGCWSRILAVTASYLCLVLSYYQFP